MKYLAFSYKLRVKVFSVHSQCHDAGVKSPLYRTLEKSWARIFADGIFPAIDEQRFSVLYSDKASRPNAPANVIIGALIIKELFDYSDDGMVENLMLNLHLQSAF